MDERIREELLALRRRDEQVREELARDGSLWDGYHPRMEEVHRENAMRLRAMIVEKGWPGKGLAGQDGAEAAWLIVQHAIGEPDFQREMLKVLKKAAGRGEVPPYQPAYLEDRICMFEGRPQRYGTQFVSDDEGLLIPWTIENPAEVNERRASIGLDSIEHRTEQMRRNSSPAERPKDLKKYRKESEEWHRKVGWRK